MAQASKNQATASKTAKSAKPAAAPAMVEEVLEDEDVLDVDDVEPDMSSTEAASDEKPESNINEDGEEQDLLEGIPEEEQDEIWERYTRKSDTHKRNVVGTGLGLSIVKEILKIHHADFGIRSKVGEGSTFWFRLGIEE